MANVTDCGELHNELWKLSDIDELFARVTLPNNVLIIDVPELDDALLAATHSAVECAKVCYAGRRLKDSVPAGSPESSFGRPAMESQITAAKKHPVPVNTKMNTN